MEQYIRTQKEFDDRMRQMNTEQTEEVRPLLDELRALNKARKAIKAEISMLYARYDLLGVRWHELEQARKDINRKYYDRKRCLIESFPREDTPQARENT